MASQAEIIKRAFVRLGVIAYDEVPDASMEAQAKTCLSSVHAQGVDRGVVNWELDDIPLALEDAVASVLAFSLTNDFSVSNEKYQRLSMASDRGMTDIYTFASRSSTSQPVKYY